MRVIVNGDTKKQVSFIKGDYFLNNANNLRQIVSNGNREVIVIDPKDGAICTNAFDKPNQLMIQYIKDNGHVTKVAIDEIFVNVLEKVNQGDVAQ